MSNYTIHELKKTEDELLNNIFIVYQQTFSPVLRFPQKELRKYIKDDIYTTNYILDKENNICGYCFHEYFEEINAVEINYIAVHPNYQGKGLARLLFDYIYETYCGPKNNFKILTLECEDSLIGFYKKLGCKIIPVNYEVGCDHHLTIMFKSSHKIKISDYPKIIKTIKQENNYCDPIFYKNLEIAFIKLQLYIKIKANNFLDRNDLNSYNYYTKEGIS